MRLLMVGCGNMGGAMLAGWLRGGMDPAAITVVDPVKADAPAGVTLLRDVPQGAFDIVLLGVKPQLLGDVAPTLAGAVFDDTLLLSILAGAELATLRGHFPHADGIVRIMPNLAAALGKSPIGLAGDGVSAVRRAEVEALMQPLGLAEWLAESDFDVITALAGSGPAFVYRFIDALASGAADLGLDAEQARRLAIAMVEGASQLAASSDASPGELARRVTSPGGTTEAGLKVMDSDGALARLITATLRAAADRGAELAEASRGA